MKKFAETYGNLREKEKDEQLIMMIKQYPSYVPVTDALAMFKWVLHNSPGDPDYKVLRSFLLTAVPDSVIDELEVEYAKFE